MAEEKKYLRYPGYVSVKEAAEIYGFKEGKLWYNIRVKKLPAERIDGRSMIRESDMQQFQADTRGRRRKEPLPWRIYRGGSKVFALQIEVSVAKGRRTELQKRIQKLLLEGQRHLFTGTMVRHVFAHASDPNALIIQFIWKDSELTDEARLQSDLEDFKAAFADVLDWEKARFERLQTLIHT